MTDQAAPPAAEVSTPASASTAATETGAAVSTTRATIAASADPVPVAETPATDAATDPQPSWRDKLAGEDKDFRKRLDRFSDEAAFAKSYRALEQKLSSGEYKAVTPFPEKGTPEEQVAWRKANGVPEAPDKYEIKLPNGVVPGEADKPGLERLAKHAHSKNWTPDQYNAVVEAYYREVDAQAVARDEQDGVYHQQSEDTLRAEWGQDFRRNVNAVKNLTTSWPKEVRDRLLGGRTADGRLIGDDPAVLKQLAQIALDLNPAASILPAGNATPKGISDRIGELKKLIADRSSEYYRGPNSAKLKQEYMDLIDAQSRSQGRAA